MQSEQRSTELAILNYIEQNSDATQREISEHAGVSLGTINLLLKRMIRTGLVKIERLQPNSIKYFLTPAGIANKVERTYGYVVRTYSELSRVRNRILEITEAFAATHKTDTVIFFGKNDEMSKMIRDLVNSNSFSIDIQIIYDIESHKTELSKEYKVPVFLWDEEAETTCREHGYPYVNIMRNLVV